MTCSTWDLMITSIPHRHEKLCLLLAELDRQARPDVGVILYRDDLEAEYGDKVQAMVDASSADYVSCVDDDDMVAPGYLGKVTAALAGGPDYVGFRVLWTRDGIAQRPVTHALRCGGWQDTPEQLYRDITQFNPVRRELARSGTWAGGYEAERRWADQVRESGLVTREAFIDEPLYWYQECSGDTFVTIRRPLGVMPPLPAYRWLRQIGPYA